MSPLSTLRLSADASVLPPGLTLHAPFPTIRIEKLVEESQGRILRFSDLKVMTDQREPEDVILESKAPDALEASAPQPIERIQTSAPEPLHVPKPKRLPISNKAKRQPKLKSKTVIAKPKSEDPLSDDGVRAAAEAEAEKMLRYIKKMEVRFAARDPNDRGRSGTILRDVDYYLEQACQYPLLTYDEQIALGLRIRETHEKWTRAFLSIPVMQELGKMHLATIIDPLEPQHGILDNALQGPALIEGRQQVKQLMNIWSEFTPEERTDYLVEYGLNNRWLEKMQKAAELLQERARMQLQRDNDPKALLKKKDIPAENKNVLRLLTSIGSLELGSILGALDGLSSASSHHDDWVEAKQKLFLGNTRLTVAIAAKYMGVGGIPLIDLIEEGNVGLLRATEKYDARLGWYFTTYATWWIRQGIGRACQEQARLVRVPDAPGLVAKHIAHTKERLRKQNEREPKDEEVLAAIPGLNIEMLHRLTRRYSSLDTPIGDSGQSIGEVTLEDTSTVASDVRTDQNALRTAMEKVLRTLTYREREIINLRYGFGDGYRYTLEDCAKVFKVTRERVRQIEAKAVKKMNDERRSKHLQPFLDGLPFARSENSDS